MTIPGLGGQVPPRPDQQYAGQSGVPIGPGSTNVVRANKVIVSGPDEGIFVYDGTPAAGNLVLSITEVIGGGTDKFDNHYVFGLGVYDNAGGFFSQYGAGFATFGTGSLAGGWTGNTSIQNDASGNLLLSANASVFINGSSSTGSGDNGGVTSGPSGTVNAFPAAGPNHTHAEFHHHPL